MPLPSDTVAIPIVKGVDLTTDARLLQAPSLLEALNTRFTGGGARKRRGHTEVEVRGEALVPLGESELDYIFGYGHDEDGDGFVVSGEEDTLLGTSSHPGAVQLHGVAQRDAESVAWNGFKLFSYSPSQSGSQDPYQADIPGSAVMPSLHARAIAKVNTRQAYPDMADTGTVKIVAWIDNTEPASPVARYSVYDSETDAILVSNAAFAATTPLYLRCFSLGAYLHIAVLDTDDQTVKLFSLPASDPNTVTLRSYGTCVGEHFDVWKISETCAVLAKSNTLSLDISWIGVTGTGYPALTPLSLDPSGGVPITLVSVAVHPAVPILSVAYKTATYVGVRVYNTDGTAVAPQATIASGSTALRLSISPKLLLSSGNRERWDVYYDDGTHLRAVRYYAATGAGSTVTGTVRYRAYQTLASRAFTIGDRTFVWAGHRSTLQSTWFLLDESLLPVGKMDFGVANVLEIADVTGSLASVNWNTTDPVNGGGYEVHCALSAKLRVAPNAADSDADQTAAGIYTEPAIKEVYLDFLPPLRSARAGRALYFAGAQLWSYDGAELTEAGFHIGPEVDVPVPSAGGALEASGTYSYKVDLCYRNAQNEEIRSLSILTQAEALSGANRTLTLTIPACLTRRENSYFLIYRNAMSSGVPLVNWWLLNSRDPGDASFLANDQTGTTFTVVDDGDVTDEVIQTRELHPGSDTYLQPISAPACEIIGSGRDRLWVAGGELLPGEVAPSRLFSPGETPSFNAYLNIQVDRSSEPLTAIGFVGEIAAFFRSRSTYILDSDGPDNIANGFWTSPRLAIADLGATGQESLALITSGLAFLSPAGFRLLGPGGSLQTIGVPVDSFAKTFTVSGAVVVEADQEVRWYGETETVVYNYLYDTWGKWSLGCTGACRGTTYALLSRDDGTLWIEADGVWRDGANYYTHRVRLPWLHAGQLGDFQRVRRVGGLGRFADLDTPAHTLRLQFYYDEREFWEERIEWTLPDTSTNQDTWGAGSWGDGAWGDTSAILAGEDLRWEWVRRPERQKCSVISISLEDVNTDGPGFVLSAITLELARKPGLNRVVERT